jgi:hypothetical protein
LEVFGPVAIEALALVVHLGRGPEIAVLQGVRLAAQVLELLLEVLDLVILLLELPPQGPRVLMVMALFRLGRMFPRRGRVCASGRRIGRGGGRLRGRRRMAFALRIVFGLGVHALFLCL